MSDMAKIVGERIRMYRTRKKLSQDMLGEMANTHGKYIGQLERGEKNATLESIGKIARALNLPLEILLENIVIGDTKNKIPKDCYNLLTSMSEKEQKAMLELIKKVIEYKNV
jgi:transcriptional regulator with XRE-family HTH domain